MKKKYLLPLGLIFTSAFSFSSDLSRQCFFAQDSLNETKPQFVQDALFESRAYDFVDLSSFNGVEVGSELDHRAPKISGSINTLYYNVEGSTPEALDIQLSTNLPYIARKISGKSDELKRIDAVTGTNLSWDFLISPETPKEESCTLSWADVSVDIVYWFPKWINPESGSEELQVDWNEYIEALAYHELGHAAIAYKTAQDSLEKMLKLKGQSYPCSELAAIVNEIGITAQEEKANYDEDYDLLTSDGLTQGARFTRRDLCNTNPRARGFVY